MKKISLAVLVLFVLAFGIPRAFAASRPLAETVRRIIPLDPEEQAICFGGTQLSGAVYEICVPLVFPPWNGDLLIYAHGYVSPAEPLAVPAEFDELSLVANLLGYATAATSYRANGLVVEPGMADLLELQDIFRASWTDPDRTFLVGPSMGGQITTLMIEQGLGDFVGGLAICAPNGDFMAQIDYVGDFRVVFDYFFPGLMPGSPINIPQSLMDDWEQHFATVILPAVEDPGNADLVDQLLAVTGAAVDPDVASTRTATIQKLLWYNVFATNDGSTVLGGQPFDNTTRVYTGSADDVALNNGVARFAADPAAVTEVEAHYQTSGVLGLPFLTDHTTLDELVPIWHSDLYAAKVAAAGSEIYFERNITARYGHCNFTAGEILNDFLQLVDMVDNPPPTPTPSATPTATGTPSPTPTQTPTTSSTPSPTVTASPTGTATASPTPTSTAGPTPTATQTQVFNFWIFLPFTGR